MHWIQHTIQEVATIGEIELPEHALQISDHAGGMKLLEEMIAVLIDHHFEKLLWVLYRIDVDENKAKKILAENLPEAAPAVLAALIMERQQIKEAARASFQQRVPDDADSDLLL